MTNRRMYFTNISQKGGHSHNYQHDHQSDSGRDGPLIDTSDDVQMEGSTSHDPNYQVSQGETGYAQVSGGDVRSQ
jgi:hypothetical protein